MRNITKDELIKVLDKHLKWLRDEDGGERADLSYADLRSANLRYANLSYANLSYADLSYANLSYADLRSADLSYADLSSAKNIPFIPISCPDTGAFIAWKKVKDYIIKLQIPEDAKRCSATTTKCRCDKALVLAIEKFDGTAADVDSVVNHNYVATTYKVGEMVYPDSFDDDRWNECSHGIHFFISRQEAVNW